MTMLRDLREEREVRHARVAAAETPLRLVTADPVAPGRRTVRVLTVLAAIAACAVLFGTVCTHVLLTQGQAELDNLEARAADAEVAQQQLQVQVAELESPARIVPEARERLGMIPPPAVVYLTPGAPRVPAPATTTPAAPPTTVATSKTAHP
jgi:cell division protein FtsL